MKKIIFASLLLTGLSVSFTACLKDKGFNNNEYGINDPDTQPPGVGFPFGSKARTDFGLDVSTSAQAVDGLVYVNLESGTATKSEVAVTLANNSAAMVAAYNTANNLTGTSQVLVLPSALYTVPLALTIPAGGRNVQTSISVSNTTSLDANRSYAIGLTISSVTGGYRIAENLKNLFIVFSVKNKYDGRYRLKGVHNRPGLSNPYDQTVNMETTGPNSVTMGWPANSAQYYSHPINGTSYYGSFTTNFIFNAATNVLVAWDMTPWPTTLTPSVQTGTNSRYDPVAKVIYANFYYNGNPGARQFWDTLTYLGPR